MYCWSAVLLMRLLLRLLFFASNTGHIMCCCWMFCSVPETSWRLFTIVLRFNWLTLSVFLSVILKFGQKLAFHDVVQIDFCQETLVSTLLVPPGEAGRQRG